MFYYPDGGGIWWSCPRCRWSGQTISMYQKARKIPDPSTAYIELLHEIEYTGDAPPVLNADTLASLDSFEQTLKLRETFWNKAWGYLYQHSPLEAMAVLNRNKIGAFSTLANLKGLIGACDRASLYQLQCRIPRNFEKGVQNALMLRFERLPGRMSSLLFMTNTTRVLLVEGGDAGLMGLNDTLGYSDHVIAVNNPIFYLTARKRWMNDVDSPPPFVCYTDTAGQMSSDAWKVLHHNKVIFWDKDPVDCLRAARVLGERGYVAVEPMFPASTTTTRILADIPILELYNRWKNHAEPWTKVLARQLSVCVPSDALIVLRSLGMPLTSYEKERLKSHCNAEQWRRVRCLFDGDNSSHSFSYQNETFIERPSRGWFRLNSSKKSGTDATETLVSEAIIQLHQVTTVRREIVLNGCVIFNGNQIPFSEREKVIRRDPAEWVSTLCVSRELGYPDIDRNYRKSLLDLARQCSSPKVVSQVERVGWSQNLVAYVFPRFFIDAEGAVTYPDTSNVPVSGVPGQRLHGTGVQPRPTLIQNWLTASSYTEIAWCLITCLLANLLAGPMKKAKLGVGLLQPDDAATNTLVHLGQAIGLIQFSPSKEPTPWEIEQILQTEQAHDLPCILRIAQAVDERWLVQLRQVTSRNVILGGSLKSVINLSMHAPWVAIRASEKDSSAAEWLNGIESVISYFLAVMTRRKMKAQSKAEWPLCIFDDLMDLLLPVDVTPEQRVTIASARSRLITWGCSNLYTRVQAMLNYEKLLGEDVVFSKTKEKAAIFDNPKDGLLHIHRDRLVDQLKARGWYLPADHLFDATFTHAGQLAATVAPHGWTVDKKHFLSQYEKWVRQIQCGSSNALDR